MSFRLIVCLSAIYCVFGLIKTSYAQTRDDLAQLAKIDISAFSISTFDVACLREAPIFANSSRIFSAAEFNLGTKKAYARKHKNGVVAELQSRRGEKDIATCAVFFASKPGENLDLAFRNMIARNFKEFGVVKNEPENGLVTYGIKDFDPQLLVISMIKNLKNGDYKNKNMIRILKSK